MEQQWIYRVLEDMIQKELQYENRAILKQVQRYIEKQYERIEQSKGVLEGNMWSPSKW
ncbi:hypothetical protein GMA11_08530 [Granulicatella sp. zg-ZJ]|uniref:hypothetical protein n=1 Tax=unclassified Granulicatella TaxID=2630493 RepID=UPI0013BEFBCE|nr:MULTISPECIES: hypothetical protein [unclassified Granulicatella]NEW63424.1 hypothetical protein [Granulicatella sp. zg-ZJ]NEW65448.1 hypothetical protein [Granulicatella sp. zg-84]QMI85244.1 hypothetical protein H1220_05825 [Carnobacteriaceae bacterium zg-84]